MEWRRVETSLHAGMLFAVLGAVAWASGQPFVFPSLGPSAFILAFERAGDQPRSRRVVGGHLVGAGAGLFAYTALGTGSIVTLTPDPFSVVGLRLAASATVSVVLTSWGMLITDTVHAPACATTLIVSLGLLSTPPQVAIIAVSVVALVALHRGTLVVVDTEHLRQNSSGAQSESTGMAVSTAQIVAESDAPDDQPVEQLDVRQLGPPEPLTETLERLAGMDGGILVQVNDRAPQHLYPRLDERGYDYETVETDGVTVTTIWES